MRYCKRCVMPDTRPGITFDENGVCEACNHYDQKAVTDWPERGRELEALCSKHRGRYGNGYDCAIAVSGGKDSTFQVYILKEVYKMNPLLISVDNWTWTEAGIKNRNNISETFGCDVITLSLNRAVGRRMMLKGLELLGSPTWYVDAAIYAFPVRLCIKMNIPLLFYGENVNYEYGGTQKEEVASAKGQFQNDVVKPVALEKWLDDQITLKDLNSIIPPTLEEMEEGKIEPYYLSYFVKWDSHQNYLVAKRYGFSHMGHEWVREGTIESYNQIDSPAYLMNQWFKYPKFGHASVTEMASRYVRAGLISRDEAVRMVKSRDGELDQRILEDFCDFTGITKKRFWEIADRFYNPELFIQDDYGVWHPRFEPK